MRLRPKCDERVGDEIISLLLPRREPKRLASSTVPAVLPKPSDGAVRKCVPPTTVGAVLCNAQSLAFGLYTRYRGRHQPTCATNDQLVFGERWNSSRQQRKITIDHILSLRLAQLVADGAPRGARVGVARRGRVHGTFPLFWVASFRSRAASPYVLSRCFLENHGNPREAGR